MLRGTPAMSYYVLIFITICITNVCLAQSETRKCLVYENVTTESTEAPIVPEVIKTVMIDRHTDAIIKVKYGQHIKLICNVNPSSSMEIKWKSGSVVLSTGKEFDIKSTTEEYHGKYITCEAFEDSEVKKLYGSSILLSDLAPPLISKLPTKVTVTEKDNITLTCKIVKGTPQPTFNWQVKRIGDKQFKELPSTSEELTIASSTLNDNGIYKCIAKNMKNKDQKTIDVNVLQKPQVLIKGPSEMVFEYGSSATFTCEISGYKLPNSSWVDSKGSKLQSEESKINWHETISVLKVKTMKKSDTYTCSGLNTLGVAAESVNVTVKSPFIVHEYPKDSIMVHYGTTKNIVCNITSSFPMRIRWFRPKAANSSEQVEIENNNKFAIANGVLSIKSVDLDMVGMYMCEAALDSDADEKISYTTDLQIDNLAPPVIDIGSTIVVKESSDVILMCQLDGGIPTPSVHWYKISYKNASMQRPIITTGRLEIKNITLDDFGNYLCISKNALGSQYKSTDIKVMNAPAISIDEGSEVSVPYGSDYIFSFKAVGYPLPDIFCDGAIGAPVLKNVIDVHEYQVRGVVYTKIIRKGGKFYCTAKNSLGFYKSNIDVNVLSPFVVHEVPEALTKVHYAASKDLVCNITATFPMTLQWYYNDTKIDDSNHTVLHIDSVDLNNIGMYRCEATLISDEDQKKEFQTHLKIDNLRAPVITNNNNNVVFKKFEELCLTCSAHGHPTPEVTWTHQPLNGRQYTVGTGESICTTHANIRQAGTYECIATNVAGEDRRSIRVDMS